MITHSGILLVMALVNFTGPDGQHVEINPDEVVSIRTPRGQDGHFAGGVRCLIFTGDGKFTPVTEECGVVAEKLQRSGR